VQDILVGAAKFVDNHTIKYGLPGRIDVGGQVTAKDIIIATGSVPFVPPGALPQLSRQLRHSVGMLQSRHFRTCSLAAVGELKLHPRPTVVV
jgi:pyruvate/2-oxoglutarate dehydrogenase complex dihydrolipoamide dehydrogenase (E3) component